MPGKWWILLIVGAAVISAASLFWIEISYAPIPTTLNLIGIIPLVLVVCFLPAPMLGLRGDRMRAIQRLWMRCSVFLLLPWFVIPLAILTGRGWFHFRTQGMLPGNHHLAMERRNAILVALGVLAASTCFGLTAWWLQWGVMRNRLALPRGMRQGPVVAAVVMIAVCCACAGFLTLLAMAGD